MKLNIIDKEGKKVGDFDFKLKEEVRDDIFKRAVFSEESLFRQRKGADPMAGKRSAISLSKRRRKLRTTYGRGGSRTPKKVMWSRGTQFRFVGAFAPNTVGGRKAHAPKASKNIVKEINNREWIKALKIGLASSLDKNLVASNGNKLPDSYPFVLDNSFETIEKTKDFKDILKKIGFENEMDRTSNRTIRAGKGTMRSRTYKYKRGPLFVFSSIDSPALKAIRNIRGFDVISSQLLMVSDFGMASKPGRAVVFTKKAAEEFMEGFE
jgi:large subunit ribosomal protein L4e